MARLFGPRRRLIQAIEQITGKASSAVATTAATVNKQTIVSGPANNDVDKISDSEQELVRLLVCLSLYIVFHHFNHVMLYLMSVHVCVCMSVYCMCKYIYMCVCI